MRRNRKDYLNKKLIIISFLMGIVLLFSCKKEEVSNTTNTNSGDNTTNNSAPVIGENYRVTSSTSIDASTIATDTDGDTLSFVSAKATKGSVEIVNGSITYVKPSETVYFGLDTVEVTVADSKNKTTKGYIVIKTGNDKQISTYNILKPYFDANMEGDVEGFHITANGDITSTNDNVSFFGSTMTSTKYLINEDGYVVTNIDYPTKTWRYYTVYNHKANVRTYLRFQNINYTYYTFNVWKL